MNDCESDWQLKKNKLTERGKYLLETGLWSDCKFLVGEEPSQQELSAHKMFLAMASPVFEKMFHGEMAENGIIKVNDINPDAFKLMLLYVYTDSVGLLSFDQACELCYVADKYMMPYLMQVCIEYLCKDLNEEKACRAFEIGRLFEQSILMEKSMEVICSKTKHVLNNPKFIEVDISTLLEILDQDKLNIDSELELFEAVDKWAAAKCPSKDKPSDDVDLLRSIIALPAIQKIRFLTMNAEVFSTGPAKSKLLQQSESFAIFMNLCSPCKENYPMPQGFSTSKILRFNKNFRPNFCLSGSIEPNLLTTYVNHTYNLSFTVKKDVFILGIQVHSQVPSFQAENAHLDRNQQDNPMNLTYRENLTVQLKDRCSGTLSSCSFQGTVHYNKLINVYFNLPYKLVKGQTCTISMIFSNYDVRYRQGKCIYDSNTLIFTYCNGWGGQVGPFSTSCIHSIICHALSYE